MDLSTTGFVLLVVGALVIGFAKTAIGGAASIAVAFFAAALPAKESTGVILPLLLVGDLFAVAAYRRHANWAMLLRLFPSVAVGVLVGVGFVRVVDDTVMRRSIGIALIVLVGIHLLRQRRQRTHGTDLVPSSPWGRRIFGAAFGFLAGFTTMVANAGGAAMSIYMFTMGMGVMAFLGTGAWFFFLVNLFKTPFSVGLGLITLDSLRLDLLLVPAVVVGALVGKWVVKRLDQKKFERYVLGATVVASLNLVR